MNALFGYTALCGFVISLAIHFAAIAGIDLAHRFPPVWGMHVGMFVVFVPFVLTSQKALGRRPSLSQLRAAFPAWALILGAGLMIYVMFNFLFFMASAGNGSPELIDGKYVLQYRGKFIRDSSAAEFAAIGANMLRGFSGIWLLFYYWP